MAARGETGCRLAGTRSMPPRAWDGWAAERKHSGVAPWHFHHRGTHAARKIAELLFYGED